MVYTDNNPLSHLSTAKLGATEHRWAAQLASFDFSIKYKPGQSNKNADALSRQHPPRIHTSEHVAPGTSVLELLQQVAEENQVTQATVTAFPCHSTPDFHVLQEADPITKEFLTFWTRNRAPDAAEQRQASKDILVLARQWDGLVEQEGVLYRRVILPRGDNVLQLVLT